MSVSSDHIDAVASKLQLLGDPSGRQDEVYWDGWFNVVCRQQSHRSFEWYCSTDEVLRVVSYHCAKAQPLLPLSIIHPGSGTSLAPVKLRAAFPSSRQVVVDISRVALEEMQNVHEKHSSDCQESRESTVTPIQYVAADLLNMGTTSQIDSDIQSYFASDAFDVWVDKGFVDAIFDKTNEDRNKQQSATLFENACRLLKPRNGFALVVSLGEDHSLKTIIENWLGYQGWQQTLHIWEMEAVSGSGELPPFGFVLLKSIDSNGSVCLAGERIWILHRLDRDQSEEYHLDKKLVFDGVCECITLSRKRQKHSRLKDSSGFTERRVMTILEIKPFDVDDDLADLSERLRNASWDFHGDSERGSLQPQWQPFTVNESTAMFQIVPVGFGISKLLLKCIIHSDMLDEFVDQIQACDEDIIQSVDVDWQNTIPLRDASDFVQNA